MAELTRGANAPLHARRMTATVSCTAPVDVSALLVGADMRVRSDADLVFFNAPSAPGVHWTDPGGGQRVELDLDSVPGDVAAVLIAVSSAGPATFGEMPPPRLLLAGDGGERTEFSVPGLGPETAIIGLEVYRRAGAWKVRAVGQGYRGGLADLVRDHGIEVDDPPPPAQAPSPPPPPPEQAPPPPPATEVGYLERCWLVWEDASRSLAAFRAATEHALKIRNEEVSGRRPRGRFDELMATADERLRADTAQLRGELSRVEPHVTAEAAPFDAPSWLTWGPRTDLAEGVLLGRLSTPELPDLRIPLVLRMPWHRAVWISRGTLPTDGAAFAWSLATRFLAAVPPGVAGLEVIDAAGLSGAGWLRGFAPATAAGLLGGGVAVGSGAAERLRRLLDLVDLRRIGQSGELPDEQGPPVRLVIILDAGAALDGEHAHQLLRLVEDGPQAGVPVMLVETDAPATESVRSVRLRQSCNNLPSAGGTLADSWVGADWTLTPDLLPDAADPTRPPALFTHVVDAHARAIR